MFGLPRGMCAAGKNLLREESGQDLVEYALLILVLALGTLVSIPPLATALEPLVTSVSNALTGQ